ncbi:MAG TPA: malate synthase A, partial [Polyangiaceae bacterium]|nr:malate synthase A [Polyangiaceae bacterium]
MAASIQLTASVTEREGAIATRDALEFVALLCEKFEPTRKRLLAARAERQAREFDRGELPSFSPATRSVREGDWRVAPAPADLERRWVEITGPAERKMIINAL